MKCSNVVDICIVNVNDVTTSLEHIMIKSGNYDTNTTILLSIAYIAHLT